MTVNIPEEVLAETSKCKNNFSCLKTHKCEKITPCEVDYANGKNVLFLIDKAYRNCPYRTSLGTMKICSCPTYYALYKNSQSR